MGSSPTDIAAARFDRAKRPQDTTPLEALRAMVRDVENGELVLDHIIVVYARTDDEGDNYPSGFVQAGTLGWFGAIGLMERVKQLIIGDASA